jgi:drug/metabolite transporter (DMT)-like permease
VNPIIAVLLGWWLAGEKVTWTELLATAGIIAAVMLVDRGTKQLNRESASQLEV